MKTSKSGKRGKKYIDSSFSGTLELPAVRRTQPISVGQNFFNTSNVELLQWLHGKQQGSFEGPNFWNADPDPALKMVALFLTFEKCV